MFLRVDLARLDCVATKLTFGFELEYRCARLHGVEEVVYVNPNFSQSLNPKVEGNISY